MVLVSKNVVHVVGLYLQGFIHVKHICFADWTTSSVRASHCSLLDWPHFSASSSRFLFLFWDEILLTWNWPCTPGWPASASHALGLKMCTTLPSLHLFFFKIFFLIVKVVYLNTPMCAVPVEARKGVSEPLELEVMLVATIWELQTKHWSSERTASSLNGCALCLWKFNYVYVWLSVCGQWVHKPVEVRVLGSSEPEW